MTSVNRRWQSRTCRVCLPARHELPLRKVLRIQDGVLFHEMDRDARLAQLAIPTFVILPTGVKSTLKAAVLHCLYASRKKDNDILRHSLKFWFGSSGLQKGRAKDEDYHAWAVRSGDVVVSSVPEPHAGMMMFAGLLFVATVGKLRARRNTGNRHDGRE